MLDSWRGRGCDRDAQLPMGDHSAMKLPEKTYMTKGEMKLPVIVDDRVRNTIREIQLYVKDGQTGAGSSSNKRRPRKPSSFADWRMTENIGSTW